MLSRWSRSSHLVLLPPALYPPPNHQLQPATPPACQAGGIPPRCTPARRPQARWRHRSSRLRAVVWNRGELANSEALPARLWHPPRLPGLRRSKAKRVSLKDPMARAGSGTGGDEPGTPLQKCCCAAFSAIGGMAPANQRSGAAGSWPSVEARDAAASELSGTRRLLSVVGSSSSSWTRWSAQVAGPLSPVHTGGQSNR